MLLAAGLLLATGIVPGGQVVRMLTGLTTPAGAIAANDDGAPQYRYCPVCGARNGLANRFCVKDGSPLPPIDEARRMRGHVQDPGTYSPEEIQRVMQRVAHSVVRIRARTTSTYKFPIAYYKNEEEEYFHGVMIGKIETSESETRLSGSGFVVSQDGEIVTNAHVATPSGLQAELTVETHDGRSFPARLLGVDMASDLALLKIDTDTLPPLEWGNSSAVRPGMETWAIGNPLDIGISITRGTMAGISGMRMGLNQIEAFLHSDAHATHGSSGGPLVDVFGRVIGVSDMGFSQARGQGYAIPSMMARLVIDRLRRDGRYERGFAGIHVRPVDSDNIARFKLKRELGSVVMSVLPDTPAARAGVQPGDVIYGINGRLVASTYLLQEAVSSVGPGTGVRLTIDRGGNRLELPVDTTRRPDAPRVDALEDVENYMRITFEHDLKKNKIVVRDPGRSHRAPGLYDGSWIKSVLPGEDWPEEPITLNYYRLHAKPIPINTLDDLRSALMRSYVGGCVAITFETDKPLAPIVSVVFDEVWPIVI